MMKLEGEELAQYWQTLLDRRMPEDDEVTRLISVMKGFYLSDCLHNDRPIDDLAAELIEFHGEKRPYGNKDVAASIVFNLGWDYKRQLCYHAVPEYIEDVAMSLHAKVLETLKENGWLYV